MAFLLPRYVTRSRKTSCPAEPHTAAVRAEATPACAALSPEHLQNNRPRLTSGCSGGHEKCKDQLKCKNPHSGNGRLGRGGHQWRSEATGPADSTVRLGCRHQGVFLKWLKVDAFKGATASLSSLPAESGLSSRKNHVCTGHA